MAGCSTVWATRRRATSPSRAVPATRSPGSARSTATASRAWRAGPAIGARFGRRAEHLEGADRAAAAELVGFYLAAGVRSITYALAPERVVVGGGLSAMPGMLDAARAELRVQLNGYPGLTEHAEPGFLVPAELGGNAGPAGTLILAEQAAGLATAAAHTTG